MLALLGHLETHRVYFAPMKPIPAQPGWVYLVGAGPGDPELLTLKAARLIGEADVLVYDNLVSKAVLALARPDAELMYAGKERGNHSLPQEQINLKGELPVVECPHCGSTNTGMISLFGSTACKALWKCNACLEPFDQFKCL